MKFILPLAALIAAVAAVPQPSDQTPANENQLVARWKIPSNPFTDCPDVKNYTCNLCVGGLYREKHNVGRNDGRNEGECLLKIEEAQADMSRCGCTVPKNPSPVVLKTGMCV